VPSYSYLSPFGDDLPTRLDRTPVLILDGEKDSRRPLVMEYGWPNNLLVGVQQ
jgi:hypothetical protein